ncbi:MAG: HupE/UreJ family protein [Acidobacteria bacterium]|nr:HupE/UreJ family protein [Acidobacteriota bacterium]
MTRTRGFWLPLALTLALPATALAHSVGVSRGEYQVAGAAVTVQLVFARAELAAAVRILDANGDGSVSEGELSRARAAIETAIVRGLEVGASSDSCPGVLEETALTEQDGLSIRAMYRCRLEPATLTFTLKFLGVLSHGHRHLATASEGPAVVRFVGYAGNPEFELAVPRGATAAPAGIGEVAWPLLRLGIQHILSGYDHLLFLFGLILVGGRLRSLLVVVTAFTVAHSITLGLAVLNVWSPGLRFVEPAIALSIAYVGVENWFIQDASRRWLITFPFGLIHGFGFAGALQQISLPHVQIPVALAAFNVGVEVGQMAVLVVVLPAVLWLRRQQWFADRGLRVVSTAIAAAGMWWFVIRVS